MVNEYPSDHPFPPPCLLRFTKKVKSKWRHIEAVTLRDNQQAGYWTTKKNRTKQNKNNQHTSFQCNIIKATITCHCGVWTKRQIRKYIKEAASPYWLDPYLHSLVFTIRKPCTFVTLSPWWTLWTNQKSCKTPNYIRISPCPPEFVDGMANVNVRKKWHRHRE